MQVPVPTPYRSQRGKGRFPLGQWENRSSVRCSKTLANKSAFQVTFKVTSSQGDDLKNLFKQTSLTSFPFVLFFFFFGISQYFIQENKSRWCCPHEDRCEKEDSQKGSDDKIHTLMLCVTKTSLNKLQPKLHMLPIS